MKARRVLSILLLLTLPTACGTPEGDLAAICELVTKVQSDKKLTQDKKTVRIMKDIRSVVRTGAVETLIKDVSKAPKRKRYQAFVKGAEQLGVKKYTCKPAKAWLESS